MKFLIQKIDGEVKHDFSFTLLESIRFRNWLDNIDKTKYRFFDTDENGIDFAFKPFHRHYVPVGSVVFVTAFIRRFYGLEVKPLNVPMELFPFAKREIYNRTIYGNEEPFPASGKIFIKSNDKIKGLSGIFTQANPIKLPAGNYQFSEKITIDSEWRAFVYNNELVGLQHYLGEFTLFPDVMTIKNMISKYSSAPVAYTLDVGINDNGTFVVEVHDFFSCGLYGFADHAKYPIMLYRWFKEYINKNG